MLSMDGDGLGLAHQLVKDGNSVDVFIKDTRYKDSGRGIVNRVQSWRPHVAKADLVIGDMVGFGQYEETLRKLGKPLLGISKWADHIELDRVMGLQLFEAAGIDVPETESYETPESARHLVKVWRDPGYVLKPSGNLDTAKTYICRDKETLNWALEQYKAEQELIIQELIDGIEVSTEGWFNGRDWIIPFSHTYEEKRFLDRDFGPNTGCMGNVVISTRGDRLVEQLLSPLTEILRNVGYRGPLDVNAIVTKERVYALEPTPRLGYDAIEAVMESLREPTLDVLFETAMGVKKEINMADTPSIAVRVSVRPWPHGDPKPGDMGLPIDIDPAAMNHIFLTDAMIEDDELKYAAGDGVVMKVTAGGGTVEEARRRAYRTVNNIGLLDKQVRSDIGKRVPGDIKQLTEWGWL